MFRAEDIQKRLHERPFKPFRIIGSEGLNFDVRHPDLVFVGRTYIIIGSPDKKTPTIFDQVTHLALVHIVALEEFKPKVRKNGQP